MTTMGTLTSKNYTYEEAKEKISENFSKMRVAPTQQELDKITDKNIKTFNISCIVGIFVSAIVAIIISILISTHKYIPLICELGIIMFCFFFWLNYDGDIYDGVFGKITSVFDKEYKEFLEKYKNIYWSKEHYEDNIATIIRNTDIIQLEATKKDFYKVAFEIDADTEKYWVNIYYYKGIDEEKGEPIFETKTIKFL